MKPRNVKGLRLSSPRFFPSGFLSPLGDAAELALIALTRESRDAACESRPEILHCVTQRPFCLIITGLAARACAEPPRFSFPVQSQHCAASFAAHRGVVVSRSERYRLRHLRNSPRIIADSQVAGQPDVGRAARGATPTDPNLLIQPTTRQRLRRHREGHWGRISGVEIIICCVLTCNAQSG